MIILGIETSCDETSAAIIQAETNSQEVTVLSNISSTSLDLHAKTGGIIPEIAAREQVKYSIPVIKQALREANKTSHDIDAIAVTYGPGLIGSLLVGVETAKTLAFAWNKPLLPVNHLFGHMYANWINNPLSPGERVRVRGKTQPIRENSYQQITFPAISLIVSGGHTDLVLMKNHGDYQWLGGTRDDAAGEAIDKIGREIHFPYPSGPEFEKAAAKGNPKTYRFPRPLMHDHLYDFSFSGLKTAAMREIHNSLSQAFLDHQTIANLARGVQDAIIDVLTYKTLNAAEEFDATSILLSGGVAANQALRDAFLKKITDRQLSMTFHAPEKSLCTDNAAMIATAGFFMAKETSWKTLTANPELYFD
jgi:N6-L-threonylcarbamoyladenine synthase